MHCFKDNCQDPVHAYCKSKPCNPADYLQTVKDFLAEGKRFVKGDLIVTLANGYCG